MWTFIDVATQILAYLCCVLLIAISFMSGYYMAIRKNGKTFAELMYKWGVAKKDEYVFNGRFYRHYYVKCGDKSHILYEHTIP